ncbi:MAG: SAF domain-containing protein [Phycisphaerae bacterium]
MAESSNPIRNKGLLIAAAIVGVIVAVLYNIQIYQVRKSFQAEKVELIKVNRPLEAGEEILEADLEIVELDASVKDAVGDVMTADQKTFVLLQRIARPIRKGEWLRWSHIQELDRDSPSSQLESEGFTTFPITIDQDLSLGDVVTKGDLVDVYARVFVPADVSQSGKSELKIFRVLEGVRVVNVGGYSGEQENPDRPGRSRQVSGLRRWDQINVQVRREHYDRLMVIQDYVRGSWQVGLLRRDRRQPDNAGLVTDKTLLKLQPRLGGMPRSATQPAWQE